MVRQIANYTPRDMDPADFAAIQWFVKDIVASTADLSHKDPIGHVAIVTKFVHWAHVLHGYPLDPAALFNVPLILAFTERALSGKSDAYVATSRSRLMRVGTEVNPLSIVPLPQKPRRAVGNPPYTDPELFRFQHAMEGLGSAYRRRSSLLTLALSTGAGLNPADYVRLRNRHIEIDVEGPGSGVVVDIPQGCGNSRTSLLPRRVAMFPNWEPIVRDQMAVPGLDPDGYAVWENVVQTRENLQALTSGLKRAVLNPNNRPQVYRLRTTWMVRHLRLGTPINILRDAAGLNSAESLFRYMEYIDAPDWETRRRFMRGEGWTSQGGVS